jgi:hypothetical protein
MPSTESSPDLRAGFAAARDGHIFATLRELANGFPQRCGKRNGATPGTLSYR